MANMRPVCSSRFGSSSSTHHESARYPSGVFANAGSARGSPLPAEFRALFHKQPRSVAWPLRHARRLCTIVGWINRIFLFGMLLFLSSPHTTRVIPPHCTTTPSPTATGASCPSARYGLIAPRITERLPALRPLRSHVIHQGHVPVAAIAQPYVRPILVTPRNLPVVRKQRDLDDLGHPPLCLVLVPAPTRTPTACCVSTLPREPTCPDTPRNNSSRPPRNPTTDPARPWTT